jgi:hypothetical protein
VACSVCGAIKAWVKEQDGSQGVSAWLSDKSEVVVEGKAAAGTGQRCLLQGRPRAPARRLCCSLSLQRVAARRRSLPLGAAATCT